MSGGLASAFNRLVPASSTDLARLKLLLSVVAVVTAALFVWPLFVIDRFDYPHAWVSAHFATMARSFAEHGVIALGGVPVQNNSPITSEPDFYIHWPPFGPIFLGWLFSAFRSDGELLVHASSLSLVALQAALLFLWLRQSASLIAAAFGTLVLLNAPIVVKYGHVWLHLHLALLLAFAAFVAFHRAMLDAAYQCRTVAMGSLLFALACFTTWEPVLALPGLAVYLAIFRSRRAMLALTAYAAAGVAAIAATFALYANEVEGLATRLIARAMFRAGLADFSVAGDTRLHDLANFSPEHAMSWSGLLATWLGRLSLLGLVGLFALIFLLAQIAGKASRAGADRNWLILAPLLAMWALWSALMPQHTFIHEYQLVLGALPVALAAGFVADRLGPLALASSATEARTASLLRIGLLSTPVLLVLLRLPQDYQKFRAFRPEGSNAVQIGVLLRALVPDGSVIFVPWYDMVPTYYSKLHIVRGIDGAAMIQRNAAAIRILCSDCRRYAVLRTDAEEGTAFGRIAWQNDRWRLVELGMSLGESAADEASPR
ncbi:MAG TPA: hypothetical protein VHM01_15825 [Alphaproteobacteria bacterium]|nr:hypothetical protein [Alphaproteobacteria bacterium]